MRGKYYLHETGKEVQDVITSVIDKTIYDNASQTSHGLMSAEDKTKLDEMEEDEELSIDDIRNIIRI